ncbi:MAG: valine--tRNA ligase [Candidatus Marinimicrobia bacterium]|nr:valine--tRNA ligase [Candidatus Neomarinimicrobiota bacterium]
MLIKERYIVTAQLDKVYDPKNVEKKWYRHWQEKGYFQPAKKNDTDSFVITIPPPNVTGILTMGHVLNNTLQDILVRHARMQGKKTLWLPGTDHAGIATQNVVEKMIRKEGKSRYDYGREKFVELVWDWANRHKSIIFNQLEELGSSFDRTRERFTLDDGLSHAVRKVFVELYQKGLIYRGRRIINWCPVSQTALSNEEVIYKEKQGQLWYFKYPVKGSSEFVIIATTRPETMLGDTAVAVNPNDKRYQHLVGKILILPIQNREIPVIADDFVDPEFGTGCVKVTPAHDPNDYGMGERHNLPQINIMNTNATLNEEAGEEFVGMDRFEARKLVVKKMETLGLLEKIENHVHKVGFSERADVMIEPYLSSQWFVKMAPLAKPALEVVEKGEINFYPERWVKTYNHWLTNIQDWCISRQLWWGHRIPVFYCDACGWMDATMEDIHVCPTCGAETRQDTDVLDTWFSSWLWPFSTMGWPHQTDDFKNFFPTDDLVTAPDIIFFWVARMIMASLEFTGKVPFKNVYFTGIIRDELGRKMSKSLGNSPDPLVLIDNYGADALRFGVMLIAPQGQDIMFAEKRLEVGRNFMNKVWNASRFILMNVEDDGIFAEKLDPRSANLTLADKWIIGKLSQTIVRIEKHFAGYRFDEIARDIYDFVWSDFCDWYIEMMKDRLYKNTPEGKVETLKIAVFMLKNILKLLHPYAPFISEEIYQKIKDSTEPDLIVSSWPEIDPSLTNDEIVNEFITLQEIITSIRTVRAELNVAPSKKLKLLVKGDDSKRVVKILNIPELALNIKSLAGVEDIAIDADLAKPKASSALVIDNTELFVPLEGLIDLDAEKARLEKEINGLKGRLQAVQGKLKNHNFVKRAPKEVVENERYKETKYKAELKKLEDNFKAMFE